MASKTFIRSPAIAPDYVLYREVTNAADTLPETEKGHGINLGHHRFAHVQVVPSAGATGNVAVLWWSERAGKFVQEHTALAKTGVGANTPYEFTVEAQGRIMFVAVTGGIAATQKVEILVSSYDMDHTQ